MPFGLCNALTTFMRLMNDVTCPCLDSFFTVYLEYILVYICTWEDHILYLISHVGVRDSQESPTIV
jgi:hypothetical protein